MSISVHVKPGTETWLALDSRASTFSVVFEDDGDTGYLYAYDRSREDDPILDAVQVYVAATISTASIPLRLRWSRDGLKAGLWMSDHLYAVVDFESRCAYSRANFPPPDGPWSRPGREPWRRLL